MSFWQPRASIDTNAPCSSNSLSSLGIAVISLELSSTVTCPRVKEVAPTQALTRYRQVPSRPRLPRSALPSIGTCWTPKQVRKSNLTVGSLLVSSVIEEHPHERTTSDSLA